VYQPSTGDGSWTARVVRLDNTATFAKAGLMLRGSVSSSAAHVVLNVRPNGSIEFMSRRTAGGSTTFIAAAVQRPPAWLRLTRAGGTVTGFVSANGTTWTRVGSVQVSGLTLGGLFVSSHDVSTRNTAVFDSVTPPTASPSVPDIVVYAADLPDSARHGAWRVASSASAAGQVKLVNDDVGVAHTSRPLASPRDYVDVTFDAVAGTPYTLWLRLHAGGNSKYNDSVWVQFSDARVGGSRVYAIGSTSALLVNLATSSAATSLSGWGWQNSAYWFSQATTVRFGTSGRQTLRIQVREDGTEIDQIVLSPSRYLSSAPGGVSNDSTIVPR